MPGQSEQALLRRGRRASEGLARAHVRLLARAAAGAAALAAAAGTPPWPPAAAQLAALAARLLAGARPAQRDALARALLQARPPRLVCPRAGLPTRLPLRAGTAESAARQVTLFRVRDRVLLMAWLALPRACSPALPLPCPYPLHQSSC